MSRVSPPEARCCTLHTNPYQVVYLLVSEDQENSMNTFSQSTSHSLRGIAVVDITSHNLSRSLPKQHQFQRHYQTLNSGAPNLTTVHQTTRDTRNGHCKLSPKRSLQHHLLPPTPLAHYNGEANQAISRQTILSRATHWPPPTPTNNKPDLYKSATSFQSANSIPHSLSPSNTNPELTLHNSQILISQALLSSPSQYFRRSRNSNWGTASAASEFDRPQ